jgi:uncharacterized membrane protein
MDQDLISRPEKVGTAVKLLYIALIIGVLQSIMLSSLLARTTPIENVMFIMFSLMGVIWFLIYKISEGRNWARISILVMFIVGALFLLQAFLQSLAVNPIYGLLGIGQIVIQAVALILLFQKPSSDWFKEVKARKRLTKQSTPTDG